MSKAACKQIICNAGLRATLRKVDELAGGPQLRTQAGEFNEEQLTAMADVMDRANKDLQRIAFDDGD